MSRLCTTWKLGVCTVILIITFIVYRLHTPSHSHRTEGSSCLPKTRYTIPGSDVKRGNIPHIIHQTWSSHSIPFIFKQWMHSWISHHPGWQYYFWTDSDIKHLIANCYPYFLSTFNNYPDTGYRVDAFRYFVLYEFGGVYADIDSEALHSLNNLTNNEFCIIGQEPKEHAHFLGPLGIPLVSNAIMACVQRHKFFREVIDHLYDHIGWYSWNDILYATGPYMLTYEYKHNRHKYNFTTLSLASSELFLPTIDESMVDIIKRTCMSGTVDYFMSTSELDVRKELCNNIMSNTFHNNPWKVSLTNHHWTHTWATKVHDPWAVKNAREFFDIEDILHV